MYCIPRVLSGFELTLVLVPSPLASLGGNQFSMVAWRGVDRGGEPTCSEECSLSDARKKQGKFWYLPIHVCLGAPTVRSGRPQMSF